MFGKKVLLRSVLFFCCYFFCFSSADALKLVWQYSQEDQQVIRGFYVYHPMTSLLTEDGSVDFFAPDVRGCPLDAIEEGYVFYFVTAVNDSDLESELSTEHVVKYCEWEFCNSDFMVDIDPDSGYVYASWEEIPSINAYRLLYKKDDAEWVQIDVSDKNFVEIANLESGSYTFRLYAIDALGRPLNTKYENGVLIVVKNTYRDIEISFGINEKPLQPIFKIDSKGLLSDQTLLIAFDYVNHPDNNTDHFRVNVYSTKVAMEQDVSNSNGDILTNVEVPYGENFCEVVPFSKTQPIFFVSVVAVDEYGTESDPTYGYRLIGDNINRDVDSSASIINGSDYQMFINAYNAYSQNSYEQRSADFCSESSLYDLLPFSSVEGCDYNKDGLVNGTDYMMFRNYLYGNSGAGF